MSWEYLCEVCGKSVYSSEDWRGQQVMCESCQELNDEADRQEAQNVPSKAV